MSFSIGNISQYCESLTSLENDVHEGVKYYYDFKARKFFPSGGGARDIARSTAGEGYFTWAIQTFARSYYGISYESLAAEIEKIGLNIQTELKKIKREMLGESSDDCRRESIKKYSITDRSYVIEKVEDLYKGVKGSLKGLNNLRRTYFSELREAIVSANEPHRLEIFDSYSKIFKNRVIKEEDSSKVIGDLQNNYFSQLQKIVNDEVERQKLDKFKRFAIIHTEYKYRLVKKINKVIKKLTRKKIEIETYNKNKIIGEAIKRCENNKTIAAKKYSAVLEEEQRKIFEKQEFERLKKVNPETGLSLLTMNWLQKYVVKNNEKFTDELTEKKNRNSLQEPFVYIKRSDIQKKIKCKNEKRKEVLIDEIRPIQIFVHKNLIHLKKYGKETTHLPRGKGTYKTVTRSIRLRDGKFYATSRFKIKMEEDKERAANEEYFLRKYKDCPGIVKLKNICHLPAEGRKYETQLIVMKHYNLGNLLEWIENKRLHVHEKNRIFYDILKGISHMHKEGDIHFDIKPDNIILESTSKKAKKHGISAAICDFGLSKEKQLICRSFGGTPLYLSPEIFRCIALPKEEKEKKLDGLLKEISTQTDVWSLGNTMWYLYTGEMPPWMKFLKMRDRMDFTVINMMEEQEGFDEPEEGTILHLIWRMLRPDPKKRITANESLEELKRIIKK